MRIHRARVGRELPAGSGPYERNPTRCSDTELPALHDKDKSDAAKQQYWLYVSMQRQRNQVGSVRLYPVQLPEQRIEGVTFQLSTKMLRIEE